MSFFDPSKSIIENASLLSNCILAILGLLVLVQLWLGKKQLAQAKEHVIISSKREAATIAAEQVRHYIIDIIPLVNEVSDLKKKGKYPLYKEPITAFFLSSLSPQWLKSYAEYLEIPDVLDGKDLKLINMLEGFSMYFIQGIADEAIAYTSLGKEFCNDVEDNYTLISFMRDKDNPSNHYNHIVQLYELWKKRLEEMKKSHEIEREALDIEARRAALLNKMKNRNNPSSPIRPIGT